MLIAAVLLCSCTSVSYAGPPVHEAAPRMWSSLELLAIACPAEGFCVVIGDKPESNSEIQYLAISQSGDTWSTPAPLGRPQPSGAVFDLISCSSPHQCLASDQDGLEFANGSGGRWSAHTVSLVPGHLVQTQAVDCSNKGLCWSVLWVIAGQPLRTMNFAVGERGGAWSKGVPLGYGIRTVRGHSVETEPVFDISCSSESTCEVAGELATTATPNEPLSPFAQVETSGRWAAPAITSVASERGAPGSFLIPFVYPGTLTCPSARTCLLGGVEEWPTSARVTGAIEQEVNGHWQTPVGNVGVYAPSLQSDVERVSCGSPKLCIAAGTSELPNNRSAFFAQMDVNGHWQLPRFFQTGGGHNRGARVTGAQCPTVATCVVAGEFYNTSNQYVSFVLSHTGATWHESTVRYGTAGDRTEITGMSCTTTSCWVVGTVYASSGAPIKAFVQPFPAS